MNFPLVYFSPGGFRIAAARRFNHFPNTKFAGSALLLLRRPPSLAIPAGAAGSGKSTLCRALKAAMPFGSVLLVERDSLYAEARYADGLGAYMLNMRGEAYNTVLYSYLARFMNTVTLSKNIFLSNTGFTGRNAYSYSCGCVPGIREYLFNM